MQKLIIIGPIPRAGESLALLRASLADTLSKALMVIDNKSHSPEECQGSIDAIIEILGFNELPDIKLRQEIESIQHEFKLKEESIVKLTETSKKLELMKEKTPWYARFGKSGNQLKVKDHYPVVKPQPKKKGTRRK